MGEHQRTRAPRGLGKAGHSLWKAVAAEYALAEHEWQALEQAARTLDEIERLNDVAAQVNTTDRGSGGQVRVHPVFGELRAHRATLLHLLARSGLDATQAGDVLSKSDHGRQLVAHRWNKTKKAAG